jgi:hypothetical protein
MKGSNRDSLVTPRFQSHVAEASLKWSQEEASKGQVSLHLGASALDELVDSAAKYL